jgi:phosphatidylserine decarboxylase
MTTLEEWRSSPEVKKLKQAGPGQLFSKSFFRDPMRAIYTQPDKFLSPADGIILYAHEEIRPTDAILDVKGRNFTVQDLIDDYNFEPTCLVIGIFMTQYDVHVNRLPTKGYFNHSHRTPYLFTPKISMIFEEQDIMQGNPKADDMEYLFKNERRVSQVYNPDIRGFYYIIQVAERDVDEIVNWADDGDYYTQGERFGIVRSGSQVDLIVPLTGRKKYELLVEEKMHVEAGTDSLVKIL